MDYQGKKISKILPNKKILTKKFNSLVLGFWLFFFPESPKFLIECGETEAALDILRDIYASNTGNHRSEYPVRNYLENFISSINQFF